MFLERPLKLFGRAKAPPLFLKDKPSLFLKPPREKAEPLFNLRPVERVSMSSIVENC
jgi:hypothetical protein